MSRLTPSSRIATALAVLGGSCVVSLVGAVPASAQCAPDPTTVAHQSGSIFYKSIGSAVGKYNASSNTSTLSLSLSWTKNQSSSWEVGGGASVDFGVAQVEANTNFNVTKSTGTTKTSTDTVSVPGHYYGYAQPKAEYRTFHIYTERTNGNCQGTTITRDYGYFDAITSVPFYAECVGKSQCTPKP